MPPPTPATRPDASGAASLILIGGGGHAQVVASAALAGGLAIAGFYDDNPQAALGQRRRIPHLGRLSDVPRFSPDPAVASPGSASPPAPAGPRYIVAIGDAAVRGRVLRQLGPAFVLSAGSAIHPHASIDPTAKVGEGVYVGPMAVVHALAIVSAHAIINTGAIVEHDCVVGIGTHIAPGAVLGGAVSVGDECLIGLGSRVLPGIKIGHRATVGAGAVVTRSVPEGTMVAGVPARVV